MMVKDPQEKFPNFRGFLRWILIATVGILGLNLPALADDERVAYDQLTTEVTPIQGLIKQVKEEFEGIILEVELEQEGVQWVYEVKLLTPQGNVLEVEYDAKTMNRLAVKGRRDHLDD